ncbi:DUF3037 domain-containing protein [Conexibacter sp. JD483]|uniref:DUF3037 domain-containing protein n=1 Tax=unclassified Conexibacter TaxID=2627773 RepID=UPI002721C658|nr:MULTISPECIES: DUF3037 domain-containing protein [unclassified Conexibacter]MDO8188866.1 DUF3037 domain-containing protein [Conexibacter sp. CPCC 205706]MDO8200444.1 DUF3037 domain-containing protein [Conexibacter sp. CPCC 205762]MDR9372597.1 DUF3037 domain-containing protein [Conexibacter sp. JD483]
MGEREPRTPAPATPAPAAREPREVFQYAILRAVPSLPRGEALNVGVVVHSRRHRFLGARTQADAARLHALDPALDVDALARHLRAVERIAAGDESAGAVARMDRSDRFGWLTAPSSALVQPSPVHTGLCGDPQQTLDRLFAALVAPPAG